MIRQREIVSASLSISISQTRQTLIPLGSLLVRNLRLFDLLIAYPLSFNLVIVQFRDVQSRFSVSLSSSLVS
jgi:hypothetical protein